MSDKPLFQDSAEQEAMHAPQQLQESSAAKQRADLDEGAGPDADLPDVGLLPGAAAGGANTGGTGPSTGAGTLSGIAPVAGGAGLADAASTEDDQDDLDRS